MGSAPIQGRLWGAAAADWSQLTEPAMTPVYETVFDAVGVGPGTRLLDAGCGSGLALQLAHKRGATVSGLDASAALLAVAQERVSEADLREGDLEALPFQDGSFDAVTAFNAMQYATDPVAALRELRRVASPGAPVAVVTWAEAERCETRVVLAAIGACCRPHRPARAGRSR
jgi:ubiquinone/menaquinone biosynthesis C-methylase UbiE